MNKHYSMDACPSEKQPVPVNTGLIEVPLRFFRKIRIPYRTAVSQNDGPVLLLTSVQHGNEVQGATAIIEFMQTYAPQIIRGKIIAIPVVNPIALRQRRPHMSMQPCQPYENDRGLNMNRVWPGNPRGSLPQRIADSIINAFGRETTHVLDIHCWQKHAAPAILLHGLPGFRELAEKLGVRFIEMRPVSENTLVGHFCTRGRVGITFESPGQYDLPADGIARITDIIVNFSRAIGILPQSSAGRIDQPIFSDRCVTRRITAACPGIFVPASLRPGDQVSRDAELGRIISISTLKETVVTAPISGWLKVFGISRPRCDVDPAGHHPYVEYGDLIAIIQTQKK